MRVLPYDIIYPIDFSYADRIWDTESIIRDAMANKARYDHPGFDKPYVVAAINGWGSLDTRYYLNKVENDICRGTCNLIRCVTGWNPDVDDPPEMPPRKGISLVSRLPKNVYFSKPLPLP